MNSLLINYRLNLRINHQLDYQLNYRRAVNLLIFSFIFCFGFSFNTLAESKTIQNLGLNDQELLKKQIPEARIAFEYASDNIFMDILDHDSSVIISSFITTKNQYLFTVTAENCRAEVIVNKLSKKASHSKEMVCNSSSSSSSNSNSRLSSASSSYQNYSSNSVTYKVADPVHVYGFKLIQAKNIEPRSDILYGSKRFTVAISYCGYDRVTSPQFQSTTIVSRNKTYLNNFLASYIQKNMLLTVQHLYDPNHANTTPCLKVGQTYDFICPIRPGFEASACEININDSKVLYIENFNDGTFAMQEVVR